MTRRRSGASAWRWLAAGAGAAAGAYAGYVALSWWRFGDTVGVRHPTAEDLALDALMPTYDIVERHQIDVLAPALLTLQTARTMDVGAVPLVRAIFRGREILMGSDPAKAEPSEGFMADMRKIGWGVLADTDRHIVMGGVTKPWQANPTFRAIPPDDFAAFAEPDYFKILFTLRADPTGPESSIFVTETRAVATDAAAREKFRWYWAFLSPGIILIRRALLRPLKTEAERRFRPEADRRRPSASVASI